MMNEVRRNINKMKEGMILMNRAKTKKQINRARKNSKMV